jgi:hypothetical protein
MYVCTHAYHRINRILPRLWGIVAPGLEFGYDAHRRNRLDFLSLFPVEIKMHQCICKCTIGCMVSSCVSLHPRVIYYRNALFIEVNNNFNKHKMRVHRMQSYPYFFLSLFRHLITLPLLCYLCTLCKVARQTVDSLISNGMKV